MMLRRAVARLAHKHPADVAAYAATWMEARRLCRAIDAGALSRLRAEFGTADPDPGFSKYLDVPRWMRSKLLRVRRLGLHRGRPLRVLDLGTGAGYFPFIAARYGHDVLGVDLPGHAFYDAITQVLAVRRVFWRIQPFEPVPEWGRFDLVTAMQICFDQGPPGAWGRSEWRFFLDDVARLVAPGGRLVLEFNTPPSPEVAALLRERGSLVGLVSEVCPTRS